MLASLYLLLSALFGICLVGLCVPDVRRLYIACSPSAKAIAHIPNTLFTVPAGIITGMMCVSFFNYYVTLGLTYVFNSGELCMKIGVLRGTEKSDGVIAEGPEYESGTMLGTNLGLSTLEDSMPDRKSVV